MKPVMLDSTDYHDLRSKWFRASHEPGLFVVEGRSDLVQRELQKLSMHWQEQALRLLLDDTYHTLPLIYQLNPVHPIDDLVACKNALLRFHRAGWAPGPRKWILVEVVSGLHPADLGAIHHLLYRQKLKDVSVVLFFHQYPVRVNPPQYVPRLAISLVRDTPEQTRHLLNEQLRMACRDDGAVEEMTRGEAQTTVQNTVEPRSKSQDQTQHQSEGRIQGEIQRKTQRKALALYNRLAWILLCKSDNRLRYKACFRFFSQNSIFQQLSAAQQAILWFELGQLLTKNGDDYALARKCYTHARAVLEHEELNEVYRVGKEAALDNGEALIEMQEGHISRAIELEKRAGMRIRELPPGPDRHVFQIQTALNVAGLQIRAGLLMDAETTLITAEKLCTGMYSGWLGHILQLKMSVYQQLGEQELEYKMLIQVLRMKTGSIPSKLLQRSIELAGILIQQGEEERAAEVYRLLIAGLPAINLQQIRLIRQSLSGLGTESAVATAAQQQLTYKLELQLDAWEQFKHWHEGEGIRLGNPFLNRMSVNRERTGMILCYDDETCDWCELDDAGGVQRIHCLSDFWTAWGQTVQHIQFVGAGLAAAITRRKTERWIHVFEKDRGHIRLIQTLSVKLPFPVMQIAWQDEQLQLLFAVRHRSGTVQIGLFEAEKEKAEWVTPELDNPQFVFWAKPEREIGVNVGGVGRVYCYGKDTGSSREIPYQEYAYPVMDKQGIRSLYAFQWSMVFCPGWMSAQEQVVHERLKNIDPFSELIRIQLDVDQQHILCEGILHGRWQYVQYTRDGEKIFEMSDYPGTLTQAVHSRDKQCLIGKYESITSAPVPAKCRTSEPLGHITPLSVRHGDAFANKLVQHPEIKYRHQRYGNEFIPYMDIHPEGEGQAVIYLHGGPHNCLLDSYSPVIARLSEAGVRVIGLNYPGSSGFAPDYKQRIQNDWGGVDADVIRLIREQVLGSYSAVALYGVSYGAYLALLAAGRNPELWSAVVACAPFTDLSRLHAGGGAKLRSFLQAEIGGLLQDESALRDRSPLTYASALRKVDLQLIHGRNDQLCPVEQTEHLYREILNHEEQGEAAGQLELHIMDELQHEVYAERIWAEKAVHFLTRNKVTQRG